MTQTNEQLLAQVDAAMADEDLLRVRSSNRETIRYVLQFTKTALQAKANGAKLIAPEVSKAIRDIGHSYINGREGYSVDELFSAMHTAAQCLMEDGHE